MHWVEDGVAPTQITATKFNNDTLSEGVAFTRPLCKVRPPRSYSRYTQHGLTRRGSTRRRQSTSEAMRTTPLASSARESGWFEDGGLCFRASDCWDDGPGHSSYRMF